MPEISALIRGLDSSVTAIVQDQQEARDIQRFLRKIEVLPSGCWRWKGHIDKETGYGRFWFSDYPGSKRRVSSVHRFAYKVFVGPLDADKEVHHKCPIEAHRWCVCPTHLHQVTWDEHRALDGAPWRAASDSAKRAITHCPQGHAYAEHGKTKKKPNGRTQRICKACNREYMRRKRAANV